MKKKCMIHGTAIFFTAALLIITGSLQALDRGSVVSSITIRDANDSPVIIPDIGSKVLTIFYADPDVSDVNDPLADALKDKNFDKSKYRGMGIANLADTIKPNMLIRMLIRKKIEKYNSTILTDTDRSVAREWGLGNCDGYSVIIVIGRDSRVKFVQKVSSANESRAIIDEVVGIVSKEIGG